MGQAQNQGQQYLGAATQNVGQAQNQGQQYLGAATAASQVIEIDRKLILRMLGEYPHLAIRMRAILADRLTATVFDLGKVRQALARIERLPRRG